jgi:hypothetical protein
VAAAPKLLAGVVFGLAFGFLLQKGGVGKFNVLIGQLLLQDFTVAKIMLTAIVVGMIGVFALHHFAQGEPAPQADANRREHHRRTPLRRGLRADGLLPRHGRGGARVKEAGTRCSAWRAWSWVRGFSPSSPHRVGTHRVANHISAIGCF